MKIRRCLHCSRRLAKRARADARYRVDAERAQEAIDRTGPSITPQKLKTFGRTRMESPFGSGLKRSDSSPPSPVFDQPPMRFIAIAMRGVRLARYRAEAHRAS